jgi:NDP-sugar pyrophosphorylase family protein
MMKKAVIMGGGEGVRLRPLTYVIPKPLLPLGPYTVIEHIIKNLVQNKIEEIYIMVLYQPEKFNICLKYQDKYGVKIKIVNEEDKMGTIGGIVKIKNELLTGPFLVVNADLITKVDVKKMFSRHNKQKASLTLGIKEYSYVIPYGVVLLDAQGRYADVKEKPKEDCLVCAGINIFSPTVFNYVNGARVDLPEIIERLKADGQKVATYRISGPWIDIGRENDYSEAIAVLETVENGRY